MGRRAGAVTLALDVWHLDVPEFLETQTENGDQRRKLYDVFPQLVISDEFMRRVINKKEWTLVDPYEVKTKLGIELHKLWGDRFEAAYEEIESQCGKLITLYHKVNARDLFKEIMRRQVETGMPYLWFKDTVNRANPNQHEGYIPCGNLCVAPETFVLTDKGHFPIIELAGQKVNIWNGSEWSEVLVRKTGENQPLLKVNFSNGESLECTYYHHFWVQDAYNSKPRRVEARELKSGDRLIKYQLPLISNPNDKDFPYAYTAGFFCGDVQKEVFAAHLAVAGDIIEVNCIPTEVYPHVIDPEFTIPLNGYNVKTRLEWLAGVLDSDGFLFNEKGNDLLAISSTNKLFLLDVRLMLQTLGVDSKISEIKDSCIDKDAYCLSVSTQGVIQLDKLGLKTNRLKWSLPKSRQSSGQFIEITDVELTCRRDDTYCFTEPKRNLGMFNGILTGQCQESYSNVSSGEYAHCCNLDSINLANIEDDEIPEICEIAVRILDNTIEITTPPIPEAKAHNDRYRTVGVGMMGLADWLAKRQQTYRAVERISQLFEDLGYYCTKASADLAQERGAYAAFEGSEWSKGNLINARPLAWFEENASNKPRWRSLQEQILKHGIRNSHITAIAPNTSSSLVQGCTASVLPTFSRFFYDKWAKGSLPIAPPFLHDHFWFYWENKNLDQNIVINAISEIQKWIDTGISMELIFNLNKGVYDPDRPDVAIQAKDVFDVLVRAWELQCKAVYYIRTVQKDAFSEHETCSSCAN